MNAHQLHERAEKLARQLSITHEAALSLLARRPRARRNYGVLHPMRADRSAYAAIEPPANAWWRRGDL